jgi:hypothetical protein
MELAMRNIVGEDITLRKSVRKLEKKRSQVTNDRLIARCLACVLENDAPRLYDVQKGTSISMGSALDQELLLRSR